METKQHSPKHQWIKEEIKGEIKNFLETKKMATQQYQNLWDAAKAVLRGKFITTNTYIKK